MIPRRWQGLGLEGPWMLQEKWQPQGGYNDHRRSASPPLLEWLRGLCASWAMPVEGAAHVAIYDFGLTQPSHTSPEAAEGQRASGDCVPSAQRVTLGSSTAKVVGEKADRWS